MALERVPLIRAVRLALALTAVTLGPVLNAAPGDLDPTFGTGGKVITTVGSGADYVGGVALQQDGKIVVAGLSNDSQAHRAVAVVRYTSTGALDPSFGTGGMVVYSSSYFSWVTGLALQSDGKIVVVGYGGDGVVGGGASQGRSIFVLRFTSAGALDWSFGNFGIVKTNIRDGACAEDVAVQNDGKIVVAGFSYSSSAGKEDMVLVRYTTTGALDTNFGTGGKVVTPVGSSEDWARSVAVQSDEKIVIAGSTRIASGNRDFAVVRYTSTGALDPDFGSGGIVTTPLGIYNDIGSCMVVQSDGKIVVAGSHGVSLFDWEFALVRYTGAGVLDEGFGSGGIVTMPGTGGGEDVALQSDGKIVVAGYTHDGNSDAFALVRYTGAGALDPTFGASTGTVVTHVSTYANSDHGTGVAIQSDGRFVVAGNTDANTSSSDVALARYSGGPFTPCEQWKIDNLGNVNAPDGGNADGDAYVNLAEYGLVLDPAASSSVPGGPHAYPEGTRLRMIFTRDPARDDVTITAEVADDLAGPWTVVASSVFGAPMSGAGYVGGDSAGAGLNTVEVRDVVNVGDPAHPRRYLRLRVKR